MGAYSGALEKLKKRMCWCAQVSFFVFGWNSENHFSDYKINPCNIENHRKLIATMRTIMENYLPRDKLIYATKNEMLIWIWMNSYLFAHPTPQTCFVSENTLPLVLCARLSYLLEILLLSLLGLRWFESQG